MLSCLRPYGIYDCCITGQYDVTYKMYTVWVLLGETRSLSWHQCTCQDWERRQWQRGRSVQQGDQLWNFLMIFDGCIIIECITRQCFGWWLLLLAINYLQQCNNVRRFTLTCKFDFDAQVSSRCMISCDIEEISIILMICVVLESRLKQPFEFIHQHCFQTLSYALFC